MIGFSAACTHPLAGSVVRDAGATQRRTTLRSFCPLELAPYPQIRDWLQLQQPIGVRDAYRRAMQEGDPEMPPMLG